MEVDDIISYHDVVNAEKAALQKGMNFGIGKHYSAFLMSVRRGAPYADAIDELSGALIYEGHDAPQTKGRPNPKAVDQPLTYPKGAWTENGKFFRAAMDFKSGLRKKPELVRCTRKFLAASGVIRASSNSWMPRWYPTAGARCSSFI